MAAKKSRLLAALDDPDGLLSTPEDPTVAAGSKHSLENTSYGPGSSKRRASGMGIHASQDGAGSPGPSTPQLLRKLLHAQSSSPPSKISAKETFALRYDDESPVEKIDLAGHDQVVRMAEFVTRTIDNSSHGLTVQAAMDNLKLKDKKDVLPGMEVRLLPHQIIGVSWMVNQERNSPHRGGILADDMGLGKTVQMIATMALNLPAVDEESRTTLIIVPAALLLQWKEEIEQKSNDLFSVHIQHGKDKFRTVEKLKKKDVIITTYQTLNNDFAIPHNIEEEDEYDWLMENGGPLARMRWYRVVIDEAQFIRNRRTSCSKAVAMLRAKYRWCLTGTPITNTLADIYGLLRFGHFRPWNHWPDFNEHVARVQLEDAPLAGLRAQEILKPLMLRRTKDSSLEGRPILELPEKHVELVMLNFSRDERELYEHVQKRAQIQINRYIQHGTIVKNHTAVLVLILRLRQLCCHPNLILSLSEGSNDPALVVGSQAEKERARAAKALGGGWVRQIQRRFLERAKRARGDDDEDIEAPEGECPVCGDMFINDSGLILACGHELCFDCTREIAQAPIAHDGVFEGEQANMEAEKEFEAAVTKGLRPCPTCKKMNDLRPAMVFRASAFQPSPEELQGMARHNEAPIRSRIATASTSRPVHYEIPDLSDSDEDEFPDLSNLGSRRGKDSKAQEKQLAKRGTVLSDEEGDDDDDQLTDITLKDITGPIPSSTSQNFKPANNSQPSLALIETWREGGVNVEPSAKMLALIGFLQEWESTGDKTICFSQWTSMLDLVETLFGRYGIQSLRYDGSMDRSSREAVLARFRQLGGPRVILISTKCGGVGLNLTSANRIINLDLSWNYASESQAYDRVHRLGQEKEVFVKRLVVSNTLEERMLKLQETKTGLAEAALGEGSGIKLHKLSVKELKDLFGMSKNNDGQEQGQTALPY